MDRVACPHCHYAFEPTAGEPPPPWCRRCGGGLAGRNPAPVEEVVALTAAPTPAANGRWGRMPRRQPAPVLPPVRSVPPPGAR
jgi:hypothetical protein